MINKKEGRMSDKPKIVKTHKKVPSVEGWYWGWCDEWIPMYYNPVSITSRGCWFHDGVGVPEPDYWAEMPRPDKP